MREQEEKKGESRKRGGREGEMEAGRAPCNKWSGCVFRLKTLIINVNQAIMICKGTVKGFILSHFITQQLYEGGVLLFPFYI